MNYKYKLKIEYMVYQYIISHIYVNIRHIQGKQKNRTILKGV